MDPIITFAAIIILILATGILKDWRNSAPPHYSYSLVIACRDEEDNLPTLFKSLQEIEYPISDYEIIIIDHASRDNSLELIKKFCNSKTNRQYLHLNDKDNEYKGKKYALQKGVEIAQYEIVLFTDADCLPPADWLEEMNYYLSENTGMIVGYSPEKNKSDFRNFSQLMTASVYCSTIGLGLPFSSNGRNLAVRKSVFKQVAGFNKIKVHPCGEDKQLLQLIDKTKYKIAYNARNKVYTKPNTKDYLNQQKRRYGQFGISSPFYKFASLLIFLFYVYLPLRLILGANFINFFLYFIPFMIFWAFSLQKHREKFRLKHILYLLIYPYYLIFFSLYGMISKWEWKA